MKSVDSLMLLFVALLVVTACSTPKVEVFAIANEGILVRSHRHTVLVDALFEATAPYPEFFQQGPSQELVGQMIDGQGVFDTVDLALVSHTHGDHFRAETALKFLERHPETLLVGTTGVIEELAALEGFRSIADRVRAPEQTPGTCVELDHRGIELTVCLAAHSGGSELANNIYIVEIEGFRFLHEGDADRSPDTFADLPVGEAGLDLAFLHDWFVLNDGREVVTDILRPRAVVLMHHRWDAATETRRRIEQLSPEIATTLPPVRVFGSELESALYSRSTE